MTAQSANASGEVPCPDPSVHEKSNRLSEQASSAALLATQPERNINTAVDPREDVLGADGRLSSKSAAQSLKHAKAQDLPSFPSRGGTDSSSAGTAAMLAKDYKMKELWRHEMSSSGSKAAVQAHKTGGKVDLWQPSGSSAGNSAAVLAMRRQQGLSPQVDRGYTDAGRNNSLLAATKSHDRGRQRAGSSPAPRPPAFPDSRNSAHNALNAAAVSHRSSTKSAPDGWDSEANQAARLKNIGGRMDREMFGEHPPVEPEVEERKHQAALRASAVSMAKQMYDHQNRTVPEPETSSRVGSAGAETAHRRNQSSTSQADIKQEAIRYIHLQDAAHKLAQERLAKVDKELENGRYREYYGYDKSPRKSRLSMRGRRKRSSSEGQVPLDDSDDEEQARRIRSQMSQLSTGLNTVDNKKRDDDRARLLAAAEKRVHARMHDMDEKVFQETGKVSQSMMDDWEAKAREKAEKNRVERDTHPGKTHIGGGRYMDQADIEAIAQARLKPTLDELNDTAEKKRARDEDIRREKDLQETQRMDEKMKQQEQKAEFRRIKDADKAAARKEKEDRKAAQRAEKEEAKVRKSEEQAQRKSREVKRDEVIGGVGGVAGGAAVGEAAEKVDEEKVDDDDGKQDDLKEKPGRLGIFGRVANRLKRQRDEGQHADQAEKSVEEAPERPIEEREQPAEEPERAAEESEGPAALDEDESHDRHAEAAAVAAAGLGGTGAVIAAADGEHDEDHDRGHETDVSDLSDEEREPEYEPAQEPKHESPEPESEDERPSKAAAVTAAVVAASAGLAAGAFAVTERFRNRDAENEEVSSLSSDEDESVEERPSFEPPTIVEPTESYETEHYDYTEVMASPAVEGGRPDFERHISHLDTGSGSEGDSDDLTDSDDESDDEQIRAGFVDDETHIPAAGTSSTLKEPAPHVPVIEKAEEEPDEEPRGRMITIVNKDAPLDAPPLVVADTLSRDRSPMSAGLADKPADQPPAPAPTVKTGPSDKETKPTQEKEKEKGKEKKGLRGFFGKLKNRDPKNENKLHKQKPESSSGASAKTSEKSFQGGAKYTGVTAATKDDTITPVTTTSAGREAEAEHVGTDGPIGDPHHVSGMSGNPAAESVTSFNRHEDGLKDAEDVSSSGVDEEDVELGRRGRLAQKLKLATGSGKEKSTADGVQGQHYGGSEEPSEDHFEEARDHFDESLAPPPAFAGQAKSGSPIRGTRFQEDL